jgi:hypothetical protein
MRSRIVPGSVIGHRRDGRPVRLQAGGAYNACVPEAVDIGLAAWTVDPATTIVSTALATTVIYLSSLYYKPEFDLPPFPLNVLVPNGVVGTSTAFQVGLITQDPIGANVAGTLLASSPAAGTISAGLNRFVMTAIAAAPAVLPQGRYWIALLNTTGTTTTAAAASNAGAANLGANAGTDTAHMRFATNGTGAALPATITPASNVAAGAGLALCAALA